METYSGCLSTPDRFSESIGHKPSLLQGSAQTVRISKFKKDPYDHTISLSILIVKAFNADFDGDQMNVSIATDNEMAAHWAALAPHKNVFVLNSPREISNNIEIPKPVIATFSNWLQRGASEVINPEKLSRMNMMPDA